MSTRPASSRCWKLRPTSSFFLTWSEREANGGFVDLYLEPFLARYSDMKYGYLIELKYISRGEYNKTERQKKIDEATAQLIRYANDERVREVSQHVTMKYLILVYNGWELVYREEWHPDGKEETS